MIRRVEVHVAQERGLALVDVRVEQRDDPRLSPFDHLLRQREVRKQVAAPQLDPPPVARVLAEVDEELAHHAREVARVCLEVVRQEDARRLEDAGDRRLTLERLRRGESHGRDIDALAASA